MQTIPIRAFVVCDDVRQEVTGKIILIGVYTGNITVPYGTQLPFPMKLAFFIHFDAKNYSQNSCMMIVRRPNAGVLIELAFNVQIESGAYAVFQFDNFVFSDFGEYPIELLLDGNVIYRSSVVFQHAPPTPSAANF